MIAQRSYPVRFDMLFLLLNILCDVDDEYHSSSHDSDSRIVV